MKGYLFYALIFLLAAGAVHAEGLFNFGTMQQTKSIFVEPGQTAVAKIFVFNVHGNRPTHVKVDVVQAPEGFTVEILPEMHTTEYNVSGVIMPSQENLVVDPVDKDSLPQQKPETAEEGVEWITMGGIDGFVPAKVIIVRVTADEGLPLWEDHEFTVSAIANWFDVRETGPVGIGQARDFSFTVRTITTEYSEEVVLPTPTPIALPSIEAMSGEAQEENPWFYATIGLAVLVLLLAGFAFLKKPTSH